MNQSFYKNLLNSITDGVYFVDRDHRITYWNKAAERLSGFTAEEVIGRSCSDNILRHMDDEGNSLCLTGCPLSDTIKNGSTHAVNVYMHHKFGHRVPVYVRSSPIHDEDGTIIGAVEVFMDNSKNVCIIKEMEALREEALTDQLTGIGNRRYADIGLERLDEGMQSSGVPFGILFADIDHFKKFNDTWGHHVGDKVLTMVAQSLAGAMRPLDVACRWGGEEFVLLIANTTTQNLAKVAERLRMLVEKSWFDHEGKHIGVTASFGGALSHPDEKAASVLKRADAMLYSCKDRGRNCVRIDDGSKHECMCNIPGEDDGTDE